MLAPTRELAIQLYKQFLVFNPNPKAIKVKFLRKALIPKTSDDVAEFWMQTHILISTPLRLSQVVQNIDLGLHSVKLFIADEADTLFDLGFFESVSTILQKCTHKALQKCYFSATMQPAIEEVLK